jgi:hypothetical protein
MSTSSSFGSGASVRAVPARRPGPLDDPAWPAKLTARVVTPGASPRLHGYAAEDDLACHHTWVETVLLLLTGELPSESRARAFEIALHFLMPAPVNEAPTHAAVITRICKVLTSGMIGTAALALGEQARDVVVSGAPLASLSPREEEASLERLRFALRAAGLSVPGTEGAVGRTEALLATLRFAGLQSTELQEAAMVLARLPCVIAEAFAAPVQSYNDYPVQLPDVRYTEEP